MVCQVHFTRPYAVSLLVGAVPMHIVLAALVAPYLKRYIINAGYVVRNIRNGHLKFLGIYRIAALYHEFGKIQVRRLGIYHGARPGIDGDKLRFIKIERQDLLIALPVLGPLLRTALAHANAMPIAPGCQVPARDLSAGFYLLHAAHSQRAVKKVMAVCIFSTTFVQ